MDKIRKIFFFLFILCLFPGQKICAEDIPRYQQPRLFVFGDSLSSTEYVLNNSLLQIPNDLGYHEGRFTDDLVWVEHLAKYLNYKLVNLARAGSVSSINSHLLHFASLINSLQLLATNLVSPSLEQQVEDFNFDNITSDDLFVIWVGSINYTILSESREGDCCFTSYSPQIDIVTDDIIAAMKKLYQKGARAFVVPNLIDMSKIPYAEKNYSLEFLKKFSKLHNISLAQKLEKFEEDFPNTMVFAPNFYFEFDSLLYRKTFDKTDFCYKYLCTYPILINFPFLVKNFCSHSVCPFPEKSIFYDSYHPTGMMHKILASRVTSKICVKASWPSFRCLSEKHENEWECYKKSRFCKRLHEIENRKRFIESISQIRWNNFSHNYAELQ